jgi:RNA polymerase sigma-70 factor (ECF subfamily)
VLDGDQHAWRVLYDESFDGLYAFVHWRCAGLRQLTEEIVQETWLTVVRRMADFNPRRGNFSSWLTGIAGNLLRNHVRRHRTYQLRTQPLNGDTHALPVESRDRNRLHAEQIAVTLAGLPERQEAVLRAKYLDQQSVAQIASAWNETPKTIESLLSRARDAFRAAFKADKQAP